METGEWNLGDDNRRGRRPPRASSNQISLPGRPRRIYVPGCPRRRGRSLATHALAFLAGAAVTAAAFVILGAR